MWLRRKLLEGVAPPAVYFGPTAEDCDLALRFARVSRFGDLLPCWMECMYTSGASGMVS